jgi:protein tyrosine phosphatase (PTP) superfamily phosphohydrolase (DUF442 family)
MNDIYNYLYLTEKLSSGMPTPEQLKKVAEAGMKFIINLATPKSEGWIPNEGELLNRLGVEYLSIPVEWDNPTAQNLTDFMDAMDAHKHERVHVHCQANYRATAFVTLYRILRLGWNQKEAFGDLRKIWNPEEYPIWENFIYNALDTR